MPESLKEHIPLKSAITIIVLLLVVLGGVFLYRMQDSVENEGNTEPQEEVQQEAEEQEEEFVWEDHIGALQNTIRNTFPECAEIAPQTGISTEIMAEQDITGDDMSEVLVSTGCVGAYVTEAVLFQVQNDTPLLASFINEQGNPMATEVFVTGASLMRYLHFELLAEEQAVYQASGSASPEDCTVEWDVRAFRWNGERNAFQADPELAEHILEEYPEQFLPYFDPTRGPVSEPFEDCELFQ